MKNISVWELAFKLLRSGVKPEGIAKRPGVGGAAIYRWLGGIRFRGIRGFVREKKLSKRKRKRRCLDTRVVLRIKKIRQDTGWCGEKIVWELKTKHGIKVFQASVCRLLNRCFKLRPRWKKDAARGPQPKSVKPRDVIQADTVDLGELFAYAAVDIFTREVSVVLENTLEAEEGARCAREILDNFGSCRIFQADNGGEFGRECGRTIRKFALKHRKIRARRKNENACIGSFHRSLRKECLGWIKYKREDKARLQLLINDCLVHYQTQRPHLGLGLKAPAEVALSHLP